MQESKVILLYEVKKEKLGRVEGLCQRLHLKTKVIAKVFYLEKVGFLAGLSGWKKQGIRYEKEGLGEEMMLFSGLDSNELDEFFSQYQKEGIEPIALKAVLTEYNRSWNSIELFQELKREHASVKKAMLPIRDRK